MQNQELSNLLESKVTSTRENRSRMAEMVLNNTSLFEPLLHISLQENNPTSVRAAWVLEFVLNHKLELLIPHLDYFTEHLSKAYKDSAVRPLTKICEFLAKSYSNKRSLSWKNYLKPSHIDKIIEACFDRLISQHKVAVKVYAMEVLFLFGKNRDWVHEELKLIIQQEISNGTAAYKARGKKTLERIRKLEKH